MRRRTRATIVLCLAAVFGLDAGQPSPRASEARLAYPLHLTSAQVEHAVDAWNRELPFIPGEVLVKFKEGTTGVARLRALSAIRGQVNDADATWLGDVMVAQTPSEPDAAVAAAALTRQPEVAWAQPNFTRDVHARPNDPSYTRQWNFEQIEMPRAWDINPGGSANVTVAVIDTGITTVSTTYALPLWTELGLQAVDVPFRASPDVAASRLLPGRDFVFWDGPVLDMVGHGTHLAGTVLEETNNGLGLAGMAYRARLMPLKACYGYWEVQLLQSSLGIPGFVNPSERGTCPDTAVSQAIRFAADNGAQVISLSLGGPGASPITLEALQYAVGRGVFVAISAGNQFENGNRLEYPAAYAPDLVGVMSVGAVGRSGRRAYYSATGGHLEIAAPGGDVRDGGQAGLVYQVGLNPTDFDSFTVIRPRFDAYVEAPLQGTSVATPHVAGLAALLFSQGLRQPAGIEEALRRFARDLGTPGRDAEYGDGLIDARAVLRGMGLGR